MEKFNWEDLDKSIMKRFSIVFIISCSIVGHLIGYMIAVNLK